MTVSDEQHEAEDFVVEGGTAMAPDQMSAARGAELASLVQLLTLVRADLAVVFEQDATPEQLLDQVVQVATRLVPGAEDAGVAVFSENQLRTVAAAGELAVALDDIQRAVEEGPTPQVATSGQTLRVADLATDDRWGEFGARAAAEGARSLLACLLPLPNRRGAVLSLYASAPDAFDLAAELVVPVFAARAAIAIAHAEKVAQLERAVKSRQVIGQAVGILMERHRIPAKEAFAMLVKASQESHVKLREVALRVTESGEEPRQAAGRAG